MFTNPFYNGSRAGALQVAVAVAVAPLMPFLTFIGGLTLLVVVFFNRN